MELNDRQIVELACKTLAEKKAVDIKIIEVVGMTDITCLLYTSPSPRDA